MNKEQQANTPEKVNETNDRFEIIYKALKVPFPAEALSKDSSRGFDLTSIKAQYLVERLNDVCGVNGWEHVGEYEKVEGGIIFKGRLVINNGLVGHAQSSVGFSAMKKNIGDAYKGAKTDSLSKTASLFGLGNEIFKGNVKPPGAATRKPAAKKAATASSSDSDF